MKLKKKTNNFLNCMATLIFIQQTTLSFCVPIDEISVRLQKIFVYLSECVNHNDELGVCLIELPAQLVLPPYCKFTNSRIIACQNRIKVIKSIVPLISLWQEEDVPELLDKDDVFLREFLILVYEYSSELMMNSLNAEENEHIRDIVSHILAVYQKIDSLPLEEILSAIDILADEMPYLLEKYELTSSMTWRTWFNKYWWAPPLILGTIIFKIWFQNRLRAHRLQLGDAY